MTPKERQIADALNTAMTLNVADIKARKNIAVAIGHVLQKRVGFNLNSFVNACIKEWA